MREEALVSCRERIRDLIAELEAVMGVSEAWSITEHLLIAWEQAGKARVQVAA